MDKSKVENFIELLGVENLEKLKSGMVDLLLERFKEDLDNYSYYLIDIDEFMATIENEIKEKTKEAVLDKYVDIIEKQLNKALEVKFNDK